jgi:hypothetical protein
MLMPKPIAVNSFFDDFLENFSTFFRILKSYNQLHFLDLISDYRVYSNVGSGKSLLVPE